MSVSLSCNVYIRPLLICVNGFDTNSIVMPVEKIDRGYVMGFPHSPAESQVSRLMIAGCRRRDIYGDGQDADFDALVRAARKGQLIGTAGGLRVFGESRRAMVAALDALQAKGAEVVDVETGERSDKRGAAMLNRGLSRVHGSRTISSSAEASERGRLGAAVTNRKIHSTRLPIAQARKLWFDKSISGEEAVERAGPGWSKGTMHRMFGPSNRPKGPFGPRKHRSDRDCGSVRRERRKLSGSFLR